MQINNQILIDKIDTYAESNFNEYVNDSISYDELMRKYSTIQSVYDRFSINDSEFESNMKSADSIKELKTMYQKVLHIWKRRITLMQ